MDQNTTSRTPVLRRVAGGIVSARWVILIITLAAMVFCAFSSFWVQVDSSLASFLAEDAEARRGIRIMAQEFQTYATAKIMVEDVSMAQAETVRQTIAGVDGVAMVQYNASKDFRDNAALFSVTFRSLDHDEQLDALNRVKDALAPYSTVVNSEVDFDFSAVIMKEMALIMVIAVIVVLAVLIFTSSTWAEIIVLVLTFLAAAIVQQGTNFLLGRISFISNSVTMILQLALSLDYAIIFCNRYKEEHEQYAIRESVERALAKAVPEVFSSSLTTIAGLTAMTFMKFRLGADLGFVLIKAIACSLLSVFLVMPGLLMIFGRAMDKTKHRKFVPKIPFVGRFAWATRKVVPILFVFIFAGAFYLYQQVNFAYSEDFLITPKQNAHQMADRAIKARFGESNPLAVLVPAGDLESEKALLNDLAACDEVDSVLGLATIDAMGGYKLGDAVNYQEFSQLAGLDETMSQGLFAYYAGLHGATDAVTEAPEAYRVPIIDLFLFLHDKAESGDFEVSAEQLALIRDLYDQLSMAGDQLQGKNYSRLVLQLKLPVEGEETFAFIDRVHVIAEQYYPADEIVTVGTATNSYDFQKSFEQDNLVVTLASLLLVMLILLFTFRSLGMPILLILVIQGSICINFAIARLLGSWVFFNCYLIVTAIQMGANIDYAIVISSRFNELRARGADSKAAMTEALNFVFPTIITSGTIMVVAGLLIGQLVSEAVVAGIGHYVGTGTIVTLILVMFVLPQLLLFGERFAQVTTFRAERMPEKPLRRFACLALAAASLAAMILGPVGLRSVALDEAQQREDSAAVERELNDLIALADSVDARQTTIDQEAFDFAEHAVTDAVGEDKLAEGESQLAAGEAEYNAGQAKLAAGQAAYDAGNAELTDAKAQYAEGARQLAAGKEEYAAGEATLAAAKQEYAAGEARLAAVEPIYNTVKPLYDQYLQTQAEYQAARDAGDNTRALRLWASVEAQRIAYETQLGGYSMSQLISEYEAGQAQLASGAAQIADGEAQLRKAEQDLAEGQAKLDEAAAQINAGQAKLDAGKAELEAGKAELAGAKGQLDAGKAELEAGREKIRENKEALTADLAAFEAYESDIERLEAGVRRLSEISGVSDRIPKNATYGEVLSAAKDYFADEDASARTENRLHSVRCIALLVAGVLGLNAGVFGLMWRRGGRMLSLLAVPFAIAAALLGGVMPYLQQGGMSLWRVIAALAVLLLSIGTFSVLGLGEDAPKPLAADGPDEAPEEPETPAAPAAPVTPAAPAAPATPAAPAAPVTPAVPKAKLPVNELEELADLDAFFKNTDLKE